MRAAHLYVRARGIFRIVAACFLAYLSGGLLLVSADTPTALRALRVGTCYCHCAAARAKHSCVKMCDAQRLAARQAAARCTKPRLRLPTEERDAGPRFPHPGRAERAELSEPPSGEGHN